MPSVSPDHMDEVSGKITIICFVIIFWGGGGILYFINFLA